MTSPAPAIELRGIRKSFGPVKANRGVSLRIDQGTIHGIVGQNGAGKSTLMSILYGFYTADAGEICIHGRKVAIPNSQAAIGMGIGMVFQHFKLIEPFSVLENVILGAEESWLLRPALDTARATLARFSREYGMDVDPDARVADLSVGLRQRVEILKALYRNADIVILDEPTGVLTPPEAEHLFHILRALRDGGKTIVLITHKLREIMDVTDTVSVMRDGQMVITTPTTDTDADRLAELMVGRKVRFEAHKRPLQPGPKVLEVEDLRAYDAQGVARLKGISLAVRAGEILGIAGVAGNGQSELLQTLGGYAKAEGTVRVMGKPLGLGGGDAGAPRGRHRALAHVPEDRQREGLVMAFRAWENMALGYHHDAAYARGPFMRNAAIRAHTVARMDQFDIRPPDPGLETRHFSGGNQQKIVVAREIGCNPALLLVGQPTRGVDIGAIAFIHAQIAAVRNAGGAVLLVSVELDEILSLSDRIAVMFDGRIVGECLPAQASERQLGRLMSGLADDHGDT